MQRLRSRKTEKSEKVESNETEKPKLSKRKISPDATNDNIIEKKSKTLTSSSTKSSMSKANLNLVLKVYKGMNDYHIPLFKEVLNYTNSKYVLYPGSDKHITPSLLFPHVVYIDNNKKLEKIFTDSNVLEWINENKIYTDDDDTNPTPKIDFICEDFNSSQNLIAKYHLKPSSFDLLISSCAGIVSKGCEKYLKVGGYFLVSDAHFDARMVSLDKDNFDLVAVYDIDTKKLDDSETGKDGHFITTKGLHISEDEVRESMEKPKNRRKFKLQKESMFYLFKKIK